MSRVHNLAQFQQVAQDFALGLQPLHDRATVVGLYGDLGSGKTTFVQAAARALGVSETVNSPTFLIVKSYPVKSFCSNGTSKLRVESFNTLIHIDAYRLKSSEELKKLRFADLLADPQNLILVEWADRVSDILPSDHSKLYFEFVDDATRRIVQSSL